MQWELRRANYEICNTSISFKERYWTRRNVSYSMRIILPSPKFIPFRPISWEGRYRNWSRKSKTSRLTLKSWKMFLSVFRAPRKGTEASLSSARKFRISWKIFHRKLIVSTRSSGKPRRPPSLKSKSVRSSPRREAASSKNRRRANNKSPIK